MKIILETPVEQSFLEVKSGFDAALFKQLSPPFPPVKLLRFDGSAKGDLVVLELDFLLFKQRWTSQITEAHTSVQEFHFVDEGVELPFFLKKWAHTHRVISRGIGSVIRDEIEFEAPSKALSFLLFPVLWGQFYYRKAIYRRCFKKSAD